MSPRAYTLNLKREVRKLVTMLRQHDKLADAMMREQIAEQIRAARPPWVSYRSFADMVTQAGYPLTLGQLNKWRDPSHSMRVGGWGGKRQRRVPTAADEAAAALAQGLEAERLLFLTDVDGLILNGEVVDEIDAGDATELLDRALLEGGIVPKLRAAVTAAQAGVPATIGRTVVVA